MKLWKTAAIAFALSLPGFVWADPFLLMAEEEGCYWCQKWDEEISHIYPKTAEGRAVPLQRYDLHHVAPDVELAQRVHFTPTFILISNGKEVGRLEGYPGDDFFWPLLAKMIKDANIPLDPAG